VVSIVGQDLSGFHKPYSAIINNGVVPLLFNNTVTGKNVSLVLKKSDLHKALNVIHGEIFGQSKKVNLAIFGVGNVGGTLVDQIIKAADTIEQKKGVKLNIFALANSKQLLLDHKGIDKNWRAQLSKASTSNDLAELYAFADQNHLENLILVDNTANSVFVDHYQDIVAHGFDLVSSNKIANTKSISFYNELREVLASNQKQYLYETNVGAGLPLINTIALLHLSGENITRIKGVFSGSLSYIFNTFCDKDVAFSTQVKEALEKGFTEPDPREDLMGNDVGRKLLILARELDLENELSEVVIQNLIPDHLASLSKDEFLNRIEELDETFAALKANQKEDHVLRYVGDLSGDLQQSKGNLEVKLVSVPKQSPLGQMKGSDSLIEIYTESYGENPIVIQGAGAGAAVTARGVFGDILRIVEKA